MAEDTLERCSAESLQTVGIVTLQTLETQSQRLARIDRFSGVSIPAVDPQAAELEVAPPDDEVAAPATEPEPQPAGSEADAAEVEATTP